MKSVRVSLCLFSLIFLLPQLGFTADYPAKSVLDTRTKIPTGKEKEELKEELLQVLADSVVDYEEKLKEKYRKQIEEVKNQIKESGVKDSSMVSTRKDENGNVIRSYNLPYAGMWASDESFPAQSKSQDFAKNLIKRIKEIIEIVKKDEEFDDEHIYDLFFHEKLEHLSNSDVGKIMSKLIMENIKSFDITVIDEFDLLNEVVKAHEYQFRNPNYYQLLIRDKSTEKN